MGTKYQLSAANPNIQTYPQRTKMDEWNDNADKRRERINSWAKNGASIGFKSGGDGISDTLTDPKGIGLAIAGGIFGAVAANFANYLS